MIEKLGETFCFWGVEKINKMVIIETKNKQEELRKKFEKIKSLLDGELPKHYYLKDNKIEYELNLGFLSFLTRASVADLDIRDDVIIVNFVDEEEYIKLRKYFEDSKTKFKLVVNGDYY